MARPTLKFVSYPSEAAAIAESERVMRSQQTAETRNDPRTVTRYFFSWNTNSTTGRSSLVVPEKYEGLLKAADRARAKTWEQAIADNDVDEGRRPTVAQGGGQGGGGRSTGRVR
jgi:hypothetical protein